MNLEENKKVCPNCACVYCRNDFYGKEFCYKCIYKEKVKLLPIPKNKKCLVCQKPLLQGRNKFCSMNCYYTEKDERNSKRWYQNISSPSGKPLTGGNYKRRTAAFSSD